MKRRRHVIHPRQKPAEQTSDPHIKVYYRTLVEFAEHGIRRPLNKPGKTQKRWHDMIESINPSNRFDTP